MTRDSVALFISELIRAANETGRLSKPERARLLERAAATLRDIRYEINFSDQPANDGSLDDVARQWSNMAGMIDLFSDDDISKEFLRAAELIKVARVLMGTKLEILGLPRNV